MSETPVICGFCGRSREESGLLVEGSSAFICVDCIGRASRLQEILAEKQKRLNRLEKEAPVPSQLYEHLNGIVIGQDQVKRKLAVAVANHYRRILDPSHSATLSERWPDAPDLWDVKIDKSNVLLIGPTGSGKTLLARSLAELLDVPFAVGDATTFTEAGYVGDDVETVLLKLLAAADFDLKRAEQGIVFIDEIDKLRKSNGNVSINRDVGGEGVQQALLKLIEGSECRIPPQGGRKHPEQQCIQMDTTQILFICGGAFSGLDEIVRRRLGKTAIGFQRNGTQVRDDGDLLRRVTPEDLVEYGLIPEFVGRLPVIATLHELSVDDLCVVLTKPRDALLKQYRKLVRYHGGTLEFTSKAIREIAKLGYARGTGARGLRAVVEELMLDLFFEISDSTTPLRYLVTEEVVRGEKQVLKSPLPSPGKPTLRDAVVNGKAVLPWRRAASSGGTCE